MDDTKNANIYQYERFIQLGIIENPTLEINNDLQHTWMDINFKLLNQHGYTICYSIFSKSYYAIEVNKPLRDLDTLVQNGKVPFMILQDISRFESDDKLNANMQMIISYRNGSAKRKLCFEHRTRWRRHQNKKTQ